MSETAVQSAVLIPQKHGGRLLPGGKKGNRGGGRKPNEAKKLALMHYTQRIPLLGAIADNEEIDAQQRINAIVELRKGSGLIDEQGGVTVNDNRTQTAQIVYLPQVGVEVHQLPQLPAENG